MTPEDEAIRNALARILTFFGVEFADANRALVFKIGAETINFPYGSAIADNSKIVEKLADVLKLHQRVPPPPQPEIRKEPDVVPVVSEPVFRPEDPPTEEEPTGFVVYEPVPEWAPAEVFVIVIKEARMIYPGDRLVIPKHDPANFLVLDQADFALRYRPSTPEPVSPQQTGSFLPPISASSRKSIARPFADVVYRGMTRPETASTSTVFVKPPPQPPQQPPPQPPQQPPAAVRAEPPVQANRRPVRGPAVPVSRWQPGSQVGRVLASLHQAQLATNREQVTTTDTIPFLRKEDRKQIASRMPMAEKMGWVKVDRRFGRIRVTLTDSTVAYVRQHARRFWLIDELEPPDYIADWERADSENRG
jgi:hypothetical protein